MSLKSARMLLLCLSACSPGAEANPFAASDASVTAGSEHESDHGSEDSGDDGSESASTSTEEGGFLFDVGAPPCGGGEPFSYIWIANSAQSTLSKIDTQTVTEVARYWTRPDLLGDPSRTSVDLNGDAVVANRAGGVTKFWARISDCEEQNGAAGIQTSAGKDEVLVWNDEECRAWYRAFRLGPDGSQRPVAFTAGEFDAQSCRWVDTKLWTATYDWEASLDVLVHLLDGDDGTVEATVAVEGIEVSSLGPYGGAVDQEGDFWFFTDVPTSPLVEVEKDTLLYTVHIAPVNGYGITVDHAGRVWLAGLDTGTARFDPDNETWDVIPDILGHGIQEDTQGRMWMGNNGTPHGIRWVDVETLEFGPVMLPETQQNIRGISIDADGRVWAVQNGDVAYRLDPETMDVVAYDGLDGAYTYSDMTGWGLANVTPAG